MRRSLLCKSPSGNGDDSLDPEVPKTAGSSHVDPSRILMFFQVLTPTPSMENQIQKKSKTCTVNWLAIYDLNGLVGATLVVESLLTAVRSVASTQ